MKAAGDQPAHPTVVRYREEFRSAFAQLNQEWIEKYFVLEEEDREVLGDPQGTILDAGGEIFFVLAHGGVQGTCALLPHGAACEVGKMGVVPASPGPRFGGFVMECA